GLQFGTRGRRDAEQSGEPASPGEEQGSAPVGVDGAGIAVPPVEARRGEAVASGDEHAGGFQGGCEVGGCEVHGPHATVGHLAQPEGGAVVAYGGPLHVGGGGPQFLALVVDAGVEDQPDVAGGGAGARHDDPGGAGCHLRSGQPVGHGHGFHAELFFRARRAFSAGFGILGPHAARQPRCAGGDADPRAHRSASGASTISHTRSPCATGVPASTASPRTIPARWAVMGCSIFIASTRRRVSPGCTASPSATTTFTTVAGVGAVTAVPARDPPRGGGLVLAARRGRGRTAVVDRAVGTLTSNRWPLTSTRTRSRDSLGGACAGAVPRGSSSSRWKGKLVSTQRVWMRGASAVNSGVSSRARWDGRRVGTPATVTSARARRARARACARVSPRTMSFAMSESKCGGTVSPCWYPVSTRIPGPVGKTSWSRRPATGAKPRWGSSAVMRNSTAWPCTGKSVRSSRCPSAIRSISWTRSTPVTSSVTGCSTCSRVLTSRKDRVPSSARRNSHVAAPTYPVVRRMAADPSRRS